VLKLPRGKVGVLPIQSLRQAVEAGVIGADGDGVPDHNLQPASLDLRLGSTAYRMRCSFLPDAQTVMDKASRYIVDEFDLRGDGAVLETNRPYLIPLQERLDLPKAVRGKANPKSSTGRVDVFTRVISDKSFRFDEIDAGYSGPLYLEVVPLSFPVRVSEGLTLSQLRLSVGRADLDDVEIRAQHEASTLLFSGGQPIPKSRFHLADGMFLSLDIRGGPGRHVGYSAREYTLPLDLTRRTPVDAAAYWEPVFPEPGDCVVLAPRRFYLLMSHEAVRIPPTLASEMTAYDPTSGELRTHYAGFFDPGFGWDPEERFRGSRAALEVRAHDVPFMIEHRQRVCKLTFEHMLDVPDRLYGQAIGSSYQRQEETLSKHFSQATVVAGRPDESAREDLLDQLELPIPDR
jgi:dCTP deaminase